MDIGVWNKSSFCEAGACVEVLDTGQPDLIVVRQSQTADTMIQFTRDEWNVFIAGVKAGDFD